MDRKIEVGSMWRHFKGDLMEVIAVAKHTETEENLVIYNHKGNTWARPVEMFLSEVDHEKYPDIEQTYRFEKVCEKEKEL